MDNHNRLDAGKTTAVLVLAILSATVAASTIAVASGTPKLIYVHSIGRDWNLTGTLTFRIAGNSNTGALTCEGTGQTVRLKPDSTVEVMVNTTRGLLTLNYDSSGEIVVMFSKIRIDYLKINDTIVCVNSQIRNLYAHATPDSLTSTLQLTITGKGWTVLSFEGKQIIRGTDDSLIKAYNLTIPPQTSTTTLDNQQPDTSNNNQLYANLGSQTLHGATQGLDVNGREIPAVTTTGLLVLALIIGLSYTLSSRASRKTRAS